MAKINKVYPAFFNGVSQQSPELVLDNQCKEMVNCIPDIVQGITKRPPLRYVTSRRFDEHPEMENASVFHTYDRGEDDEEYIMVNTDSESEPVQVFNKAGEQMRVNIPWNKRTEILDYLTNGSLKGLTVQDRTWVFSKNATVSLDTSGTYPLQPDYTRVAFYWLKRGSGDRYNPFNYAVYLNNQTFAVDPDKPAAAGDAVEGDPATGAEDSDVAAQLLADKINAASVQAYAGELSLAQSLAYKEFHIYIGTGKTGVSLTVDTALVDVSDSYYSSATGIFSFFARVQNYEPFGSTVVTDFTINEDNAAGFTAEVRGSMLKIYKDDGSDFNFSSWDSWGNQASEGWKGEVNKISDLPKDMPFHDVYVKILGDESNTFTDYFVHWNGSSWEECLDPEADRGVLSNMPLKMDRNYLGINSLNNLGWLGGGATRIVWLQKGTDNVFLDVMFEQGLIQNYVFNLGYSLYVYVTGSGAQFKDSTYFLTQDLSSTYVQVADEASTEASSYSYFYNHLTLSTSSYPTAWFDVDTIDWSTPRVGNIDNNPDPSFVGRKVQDLFFYKNRLGIASEDSVSLTEAANYTNFYATTVVDIVDTDVIDITISTNQASKIYYARPFNNSLYIFTKYAQYELVAEGIFSPSTVSLNNTTNYPMATDVEPIVVNDSLYFVSTTNNRQQLREYIKSDNLNVTGIDLNVSTPTYLSKPIKKLVADGVLGYVLCCTDENTIYLYNFKHDGTQRIQSAWSTWELFQDYAEYGVNLSSIATSVARIITGSEPTVLDTFLSEIPEGETYARGDFNENGEIDISDQIIVLRHITGLGYSSKVDRIAAEYLALYESDPETYSVGIYPTNIKANSFEYYSLGSTLLIMFKGTNDYRYHQLELDYKYKDERVDSTINESFEEELFPYKASIKLPDYYPKLTDVRTPLNKVLIKKITIQGVGNFDAEVYRKDYNTTYVKKHNYGLNDLDLHVASKVGNVEITIQDSSSDNFVISSIVLEGLLNTTSREMR